MTCLTGARLFPPSKKMISYCQVDLVVAAWQKVELKDFENPRPENYWQPFIVGYMLHHLKGDASY